MQQLFIDEQITLVNYSIFEITQATETANVTLTTLSMSISVARSIAPSITATFRSSSKTDDDFPKSMSPHKLNIINQNKNLEIASQEA